MSNPTEDAADDAPDAFEEERIEAILDHLTEANDSAVTFDDLESALLGVGGQYTKTPLAVYSASKMVDCFVKQGMTYEEATEWYELNVACLWAGEHTPIIVEDRFD